MCASFLVPSPSATRMKRPTGALPKARADEVKRPRNKSTGHFNGNKRGNVASQNIVTTFEHATDAPLGSISIARRKLFDEVMDGFLLGNTNARALFTASEGQKLSNSIQTGNGSDAVIKVLYVGVGDVRNALSTLSHIPEDVSCELVLNDASALTLARAVLLLDLSSYDANDVECCVTTATAVWSDALLSEEVVSLLAESLDRLIAASLEQKAICWLEALDSSTRSALGAHWSAWLRECKRMQSNRKGRGMALFQARERALHDANKRGSSFVGHGRAGISRLWRRIGVTSVAFPIARNLSMSNPTLFDARSDDEFILDDCMSTKARFVEFQGPLGAFGQLEGLFQGGTAMAQTLIACWRPLFAGFSQRIRDGRVKVRAVIGDCTTLLESGRLGSDFLAIDTSNLIDYVGLWNVLLLCEEKLAKFPGSFIFTEQIMGLSTDLENMLRELSPHDPFVSRAFARLMALQPEAVPSELGPCSGEKVVHVRWTRRDSLEPSAKDWDLSTRETLERAEAIQQLEEAVGKVKNGKRRIAEQFKDLTRRLENVASSQEIVQLAQNCAESRRHGVPFKQIFEEQILCMVKELEQLAEPRDDSPSALFLSAFYKWMHSVLVPEPFPPAVLRSSKLVLETSQPLPFGTAATVAKLVARLKCSSQGNKAVGKALHRFFRDPNLYNFDHIRNRSMALKVQMTLYGLLEEPQPRLARATVYPIDNLFAPKAGLLEPALALFLLRTEKLAITFGKLSQRYRDEPETGQPVNLVFDLIAQTPERDLQIFDNVSYTRQKNEISFLVPNETEGLNIAKRFPVFFLVDVQQYRVLTEPSGTCEFEF